MPVTNRHIVMLSGSARKAMSTRSVPTGTHSNRLTTSLRSSTSRESRSANTPAVTTNAAATIAVAR